MNEKIDKNAHYFILMKPYTNYPALSGGNLHIKLSSSREKWVECVIVEDRYKISDNYKIEVQSLEEGYGRKTFYIGDFLGLLETGYIVKKEFEDMRCVEEKWIEPIYGKAYVEHSAYTVKRVLKK